MSGTMANHSAFNKNNTKIIRGNWAAREKCRDARCEGSNRARCVCCDVACCWLLLVLSYCSLPRGVHEWFWGSNCNGDNKVGGVSSMLRGSNRREYGGRCGWWEMRSRIWYFDNQPSIHASRWEQKYGIDWSIPGLSDIGLERWWIDGIGIMKWVIGSLHRNPWLTATQTTPLRAIHFD